MIGPEPRSPAPTPAAVHQALLALAAHVSAVADGMGERAGGRRSWWFPVVLVLAGRRFCRQRLLRAYARILTDIATAVAPRETGQAAEALAQPAAAPADIEPVRCHGGGGAPRAAHPYTLAPNTPARRGNPRPAMNRRTLPPARAAPRQRSAA